MYEHVCIGMCVHVYVLCVYVCMYVCICMLLQGLFHFTENIVIDKRPVAA